MEIETIFRKSFDVYINNNNNKNKHIFVYSPIVVVGSFLVF